MSVGNAGVGLNPLFADSEHFAPTVVNASNTTYNTSGPCPNIAKPTDPYIWLNATQACKHVFSNGNLCPSNQPEYSAYREPSFGSGDFEVVNKTHAKWSYYRNLDQQGSAEPADWAWIVRKKSCNPQGI